MQTPLAARFPAEMLDRVGEIELGRRDARFRQRAPQEFTRRADERFSLLVFLVARLLADQHQARLARTFAGHPLRGSRP